MLQPERMLHVQLLAKREDKPRLISVLADAQMMHISDHKKEKVSNTEIDIGEPLAGAQELSNALTKARNLLSKLPKDAARVSPPGDATACMARIEELAAQFAQREEKTLAATRELEEIAQQRALLAPLATFDDPIEVLFQGRRIESILARPAGQTKPETLVKLKALFTLQTKNGLLITVKKDHADIARSTIKGAGYQLLDMAPLRTLSGTVAQAELSLKTREDAAKKALRAQSTFLENFATHVPTLRACEEVISLDLLKAQAPLRFGTTKKAVLIHGFIPTRRERDFRKRLDASNIKMVLDITPAHDAPVQLRNPPQMRNFEELIALYTLPRYDEIDPTSIMAFTFPLFFGFMLGDIGYGLALLLIFLGLRMAMPSAKRLCDIVIISSISSIIFGYIYGEVFGAEHIFGIEFHPILHRAEDIPTMFLIAGAIGVVHLNIGLIMGIINESHHHGWLMAFVKKGSWIVLQAGVLLVAAAKGLTAQIPVLSAIHVSALVGWIVLGLGVVGILVGEKLQGLFELPSIFGNILSYLRLVAIGLSSVYLALVVNEMGGNLVHAGGIWMVVGIIVIVLGHALNLALGLLGPFLHSLRLHYAEFFMKFYAGGGKPYTPFGAVRQ